MSGQGYRHLGVERRDGGVMVVAIDVQAQSQNVFSQDVMAELSGLVSALASDAATKVVVFRSKKAGSFFAGANVKEFGGIKNAAAAEEASRAGQELFARVEGLKQKTIAAIQGVCLGGGLEFVLSCDYRFASEDSATRLGLPEVELGILPAWGGTQRLPRLVGLVPAFGIMLQGKKLSAKEAVKIGLVDGAASPEQFDGKLDEFVRKVAAGENPRQVLRTWTQWFLNQTGFGRGLVFSQTQKRVSKQAKDYPAVLKVLESVRTGYTQGREAGFAFERKALGELMFSTTCRSLLGLFYQRERARSGVDWVSPSTNGPTVKQIAVIGGGIMGAGIAQLAATRGYGVVIKEANEEFAMKASAGIESTLNDLVEKKRMSNDDKASLLKALKVTTEWGDVANADLAIEAVPEKMALKNQIFGELSSRLGPNAIFATNTSALSVDEMASAVSDPGRMGGLHFFNPVHRMQLVEIVKGAKTSPETLAGLLAVTKRLGKVPVVVKNSPGFLVNRVLMPYLDEGVRLLCEGNVSSEIDRELRKFGMPMGPIELLDQIGLDVGLHVAKTMEPYFGGESPTVGVLSKMVELGRLGKKTGRGFYGHDQGDHPVPIDLTDVLSDFEPPHSHDHDHDHDHGKTALAGPEHAHDDPSKLETVLSKRCVLALINESVKCLDEQVVEKAWMADLAMVLGTGYAPFRGGPLKTADAFGVARIHGWLKELENSVGARFKPAEGIVKLAGTNGKFYEGVEFGFQPEA